MRAAIHARYSSENQQEASIDDQGWRLVETYTDHAISGATALRPGYQSLPADARAGHFAVVVAEGLDRLSRDQERIAALFLKDLAIKTHRGLEGRVHESRSAGGKAFGYDVVRKTGDDEEAIRGLRQINNSEAIIVNRIFQEFASGKSPRATARGLNEDDIPGPSGKS